MNTRNRNHASSRRTPLKACCLAAILSTPAIGQDCDSVSILSTHRDNEVEVGSTLKQSSSGLSGTWSDYLSASRAHLFDPYRRSVAQMSHYSQADPDQTVVFLSADGESVFHSVAAKSNFSMRFEVDNYWERDLTRDYGYWSALKTVVGEYDYWYGSSTHMTMWIEQETRASSGELEDRSADYPNAASLWHIEDGTGFCLSTPIVEESVIPGTPSYWTNVQHRKNLLAGKYDLDLSCGLVADGPSPMAGTNAGTSDLTMFLEFENRGIGTGQSNQTSVDRRCTAKIRNAKYEDSSSSDLDGSLEAQKVVPTLSAKSTENVLVEETGFWGRHTAAIVKSAGSTAGRSEAVAETVVKMMFHDEVNFNFYLNGLFRKDSRMSSGTATIEILNSSGDLVYTRQAKANIDNGSALYDPYTDLSGSYGITTPGSYEIRITTKAKAGAFRNAANADVDCSFVVVIDELP